MEENEIHKTVNVYIIRKEGLGYTNLSRSNCAEIGIKTSKDISEKRSLKNLLGVGLKWMISDFYLLNIFLSIGGMYHNFYKKYLIVIKFRWGLDSL